MGLHDPPLGLVEAGGLVEDLDRHPRLAHVVQQRGHAQVVELEPGEPQLLAQRHGEDADVHRVGERVLVVVPDGGEADDRGLVVEHLVHDELHRALHPLDAGGPPHPDAGDHFLGDRHALRIHPLRRLLGLLRLRVLVVGGALDLQARHPAGAEPLGQLVEPLLRLAPLGQAEQQAEEDLPLAPVAAVDPERADIEGPEHGEDVAEGGVVVELEPEAGGVHEDEVAGEPELQVALDREQRLGGGVEIVERLLHRRVLDRVELEAAERGVEREQQRAPALAELPVGAGTRGGVGGMGHDALSRSARFTALRTTRSLSSAACPASRAPPACGSCRSRSPRRPGSPAAPSS